MKEGAAALTNVGGGKKEYAATLDQKGEVFLLRRNAFIPLIVYPLFTGMQVEILQDHAHLGKGERGHPGVEYKRCQKRSGSNQKKAAIKNGLRVLSRR